MSFVRYDIVSSVIGGIARVVTSADFPFGSGWRIHVGILFFPRIELA